ncbi:MAG TPA: hypothetical protein VD997_16170 [Phycisphaerales bacterium]|nr:hypothetical protein [Phycisphaerales bacterium]
MFLDKDTLVAELTAGEVKDLRNLHRELKAHLVLQLASETSERRAQRRSPHLLPDPIPNHALAKKVALDAEYISKQLKRALRSAGRALPTTGQGIPLRWSHQTLRAATPHLPERGTLRKALEKFGFGKPN